MKQVFGFVTSVFCAIASGAILLFFLAAPTFTDGRISSGEALAPAIAAALGVAFFSILAWWLWGKSTKDLANEDDRRIRRRQIPAAAVGLCGWIALICGACLLLASVVSMNVRLLDLQTENIFSLVGPFLIIGGFFVLVWSRRMAAVDANYLLSTDKRPPLIYLRAFDDDVRDRRQLNYIALISPIAAIHSWEAHIAGLMNNFGPFVAIGRPGEPLPELGASRMYVSDDEWKSEVFAILKRCKLTVLRGGQTEGLRWELGEIVNLLEPRQILLMLPPQPAHREEFRLWANEVLPTPIPENVTAPFLMFDDSWTPVPLARRRGAGIFFRCFLSPFRAGVALTETLAPFLRQLDSSAWESFSSAESRRIKRRKNIVLTVLAAVIGIVVALIVWSRAELEATEDKQQRLRELQEQQRLRLEQLNKGRSQ